jgi:GH24 family phage-related lysozyme (muramidase)
MGAPLGKPEGVWHSGIGITMQYVKIAEHYKVEAVEKMEKYRAAKMQKAEAN